MPMYMFQARYTAAAFKAMVDNPQDREVTARPLIEAVGRAECQVLQICVGQIDGTNICIQTLGDQIDDIRQRLVEIVRSRYDLRDIGKE